MRVDLFDFELPPEAIALRPASPRDSARMLVVPAGAAAFDDLHVTDLPSLLRPGDALVVNDTRVIRARLDGFRARGETKAHIEATLIERLSPSHWRALARPAKKLRVGERIEFGALAASVEAKGESWRNHARLRSCRRRARRGHRGAGLDAAAALYRRQARCGCARRRRLSNAFRARTGSRRRADGGAAFHAGRFSPPWRPPASRCTM